jgi:hypothetical protein
MTLSILNVLDGSAPLSEDTAKTILENFGWGVITDLQQLSEQGRTAYLEERLMTVDMLYRISDVVMGKAGASALEVLMDLIRDRVQLGYV